ncbi:MAG: hypothetical protein D3924_18330, partial [Candidatus Electrothrix sp. AR4]|nr:hypothetical protein [Candidatus Electrothrix sp. AR4]
TDTCVEDISLGQTLDGELINESECISDSRHYNGTYSARYYTFRISRQAAVTITMNGNLCYASGTLLNPYIYLHAGGRDGALITFDDDGGCSYNSQIIRTLEPGTYTVEATTYLSTQQGTFQLSVQ